MLQQECYLGRDYIDRKVVLSVHRNPGKIEPGEIARRLSRCAFDVLAVRTDDPEFEALVSMAKESRHEVQFIPVGH